MLRKVFAPAPETCGAKTNGSVPCVSLPPERSRPVTRTTKLLEKKSRRVVGNRIPVIAGTPLIEKPACVQNASGVLLRHHPWLSVHNTASTRLKSSSLRNIGVQKNSCPG